MPQSPKRILIFSLSYYPRFIGGAEVAIKEITDRISPDEIEFHMVTLRYDSRLPKTERIGNVFVHRIGFATANPSISDLRRFPLRLNKFLFQLLAARTALQLHTVHAYDAIWAMMAHASGIPAGIFKSKHPKVPYLLTLQEGDPLESIERSMRFVFPLFQQGFSRADALQPISTFLARWGTRMGFKGVPQVVPNGVDLARFAQRPSPEEIQRARTTLNKKEGDILLITTSRLVSKNAVDDVIRALAKLAAHISFVVCGIGPEEERLKLLAKEQGVEDRVRWLGEIPHQELPSLLAASDIFIRPSRSEGMGNSFIEAMAAGIPVIATQEGGIGDFLFDAKRNPEKEATGFAVDPDAPDQIVEVVNQILANPEATQQAVTHAKDLVVREYGWDGIAVKMKSVFDRLVG